MNTYTISRWTTMPVLTVKADSYDEQGSFVNFYTGTTKVYSILSINIQTIVKS
jgi:hypothetical protein